MPSKPSSLIKALLCLGVLLAVIFHQSFGSGKVLFSNDGPLGLVYAHADHPLAFFTGYWEDLEWIGVEQPSGTPNLTQFIYLTVGSLFFGREGAIIFAKFYAPISLLILGLCAWTFFRQLRFSPSVCLLASIATTLNMNTFSNACWGLPSWTLAWAMVFLALAAVVSPAIKQIWVKLALAGFAIGMNVMQGFDVGAIFSIYIAAFTFLFYVTEQPSPSAKTWLASAGKVLVMAAFAVFLAAQVLSTLVNTQIKGVKGAKAEDRNSDERWNFATQWSLPKIEILRVVIPGLFGYRMDTPDGGQYWGNVGSVPSVPGSRSSGSGEYAGVLVVLLATWALAQSARGQNSPIPMREKTFIWFWAGAGFISLILACGRYTPFYRLVYDLPYFSTIRNPIKFMQPFQVATLILAAFGLHDLYTRYLARAVALKSNSVTSHVKLWWKSATGFEAKWTMTLGAAVAGAIVCWFIYASSVHDLVGYLKTVGFAGPQENPDQIAASIAKFSQVEVTYFLIFLTVSAATLTLIVSGALSGQRSSLAVGLLGLILVADGARANAPWIIYWNYREKYEDNAVIYFLREKPYEHRVAAEIAPLTRSYLSSPQVPYFGGLCNEWLQHHFMFNDIQSLDISQMPRVPELDDSYMKAFRPTDTNLTLCSRLWELTNTRYIIGMTGFLNELNQRFDPALKRFRVAATFELAAKPGVTNPNRIDQLTAVPAPNGNFAIFEFTGALPRVQLYSHWQSGVSDTNALQQLASPAFDPHQTVLVSDSLPAPAASTNASPGTVDFDYYSVKDIRLNVNATAPCVLLLNDKINPGWTVTVNGQPAPVLRCNYIMRGVYLQPGQSKVEFRFASSVTALYISLIAIVIGLGLCAYVGYQIKTTRAAEPAPQTTAKKGKS